MEYRQHGVPSTLHTAQLKMAEAVGFEPTAPLQERLISSQLHTTTLPRLLSPPVRCHLPALQRP